MAYSNFCVFIFAIAVCIHILSAKPVGVPTKKEAEVEKGKDDEYLRYMGQVMELLETDEEFKLKLHNATEDDIRSGRIASHIDILGHGVRTKLDELKRMEVEYQRQLQRQRKDHLNGIKREMWNPLHHENQVSFESEDFKKLLLKHHEIMEEIDRERKKEFKDYEIEKEHKRQEHLKNLTEEDRKKEEEEYKHNKEKKHEKIHHPGSKKQLEEVWEEEDHLDPDSFDPKTFFKLHDKNGDNYLDTYELETLFLGDVAKAYNDSDPNMDPRERDEELERMREHVMNEMDKDKDGFVSLEEFMMQTQDKKFEEDEDWAPLTDEDQFTPEELEEYEKSLAEREKAMGSQGVPQHEEEHHKEEKKDEEKH